MVVIDWISQFFYDFIHLTEGEKLIKYWYVWLLAISIIYLYLNKKSDKK